MKHLYSLYSTLGWQIQLTSCFQELYDVWNKSYLYFKYLCSIRSLTPLVHSLSARCCYVFCPVTTPALGSSLSWKGLGGAVRPSCHASAGPAPGTAGSSVKRCSSAVKKRKSCILARVSPRHCRRPREKGTKCSSLTTLPSLSRNRSGLN